MSSSQYIRVELHNHGIAKIIMNRPPVNCYDHDFMKQLCDAVDIVESCNVRVALITSENDRFFSAGADVKWFSERLKEAKLDAIRDMIGFGHATMRKIMFSHVIFIAVIEGDALGGGLEIALACDFRWCLEDQSIQLGLPECKLGLMPGMMGTVNLPDLVGQQTAQRMMLTGQFVGPSTAKWSGLVDECRSEASLWKDVLAFANKLAQTPSQSLDLIKGSRSRDHSAMDNEMHQVCMLFENADTINRIAKFAAPKPKTQALEKKTDNATSPGSQDESLA